MCVFLSFGITAWKRKEGEMGRIDEGGVEERWKMGSR